MADRLRSTLPFIVVAALVLAAMAWLRSDYLLGIGVTVGVLALGATGMVLMFGFAHQLVLGQAAFCIIGAYGSGLLTLRAGWSPWAAMAASACVAMAFAWLIGKPILRLRGFVLAMASLAIQLILIHTAAESLEWTGGSMGLTGVPALSIGAWQADSAVLMLGVTWAFVIVAVGMTRHLKESAIGRSLRAIASSEAGAASVGIDIPRQKLRMFIISAAFASLAGSLTAHYLRIIEPQVFDLQYGFAMLTAVILGGLLSPWGGVIGAVLITVLRESLKGLSMPLLELSIVGVVTVAALIAMPGGLAGLMESVRQRSTRRADTGGPSDATVASGVAPLPHGGSGASSGEAGPLLVAENVSISFGSLKAVDGVSFSVPRGQVTALIGPNGAGKTTTFNLLSGFLPCDGGRVIFDGREIQQASVDEIARLGVGRTFQLIQLFGGLTVLENVMCGRQRFETMSIVSTLLGGPATKRHQATVRAKAMQYLDFVGLAHVADALPGSLPFGQQRQVELARALALEPTLLIMDEPASGLNDSETESLARLIVRIRDAGTTVLLVEHDLRLVMGLADHVVVMDRGRKLEDGPPDVVRQSKGVIDAYLVGVAA